ncbi:MAG: xanthine dehydrogenase family protein molybdopterin-binding subunit [Alphaproteobacteria bacterium]|nr:xanthine dehydrogenase family protein molybdopterin-binding subunit [Alphaproteobacteria bacterium]
MTRARIGQALPRKEDWRLVTGQGQFADDLDLPGALHAAFVRSPHAHAHIRALDFAAALAQAGVVTVLSAQDAKADGLQFITHATGGSKIGSDRPLLFADGSERIITQHFPLASERVRYLGEIVAVVIATSRADAEAGAELVHVDYEALPSVSQAVDALKPDAPQIWPHVPGNLCLDAQLGDAAATEQMFAKAKHSVKLVTQIQRVTGVHLEPRAAAAIWDETQHSLILHASHGIGVVQMRSEIAAALSMPIDKVRISAPGDVGGNFGTRNATYPEFVLITWAARRLKSTVRQVTSRTEAFLTDFQGRDLHVEMELALDAEGQFLALRSSNISNLGAHTASFVPLNKGLQLMTSVYAISEAHLRGRAALSNTPSTIPYRSAGRPEAMYAMERLIDLAALRCGFDRVDLRRRNLIPATAMPYRNAAGVTYDNGDYHAAMERALELGDWAGFEARRNAALAQLIIGTQASGQGHETSFSMLVSDWLGIDFERVDVRYGDTQFVIAGGGSHSGRSMRFASLVIRQASTDIIERARQIAARLLETASEDLHFAEGRFTINGTDRSVDLFTIAAQAQGNVDLPEDLRGPLQAMSDQITPGLAFPYGAQVCEIEIDPQTGYWTIISYVAIDDVGVAVNPLILHGQTHGGIAQGAGQALLEQCVYDRTSGQMLSASFMDYAMPRAADFPSFITELSETPASSHPLGLRPGGEGGTTPALGVCMNAIMDALRPLGVEHFDMPATPYRIWTAIKRAQSAQTNLRTKP